MQNIKPIRCGIVGLGRSGWDIHLKCIENNKKYCIEGLYDENSERLINSSNKLNCKKYSNYQNMLDDKNIDLVIIATPSKTHYSFAKLALKAKKHVILEKPLASKIEEVLRLKNLAKENEKLLVPFFNYRFVKEYQIIKTIFNENLIGKIFLIKRQVSYYNRRDDWQSQINENGGIINAATIHHVDQIIQLIGEKPKDIWKDLRNLISKGDAPDHSKILMKFPNECVADIEVSWAEALPGYPWHIFGTHGSIRQDKNILECKWFVEKEVGKIKNKDRSYLSDEKIPWKNKKYTLDINFTSGITPAFYDQLSESLFNKKKPPVSIDSVLDTMNILEKISKN